jgi:hypothetical protein
MWQFEWRVARPTHLHCGWAESKMLVDILKETIFDTAKSP